MTQRRTKKQKIERAVILITLVVVLGLLAFFLRDILFPLLRMQFKRDRIGAEALLRERGFLGCLTVVLVEALQMVVIFIPAEFIQISAGLSFPFPVALLLCDLGVCLGASIIFLLVRLLRFREDSYRGKEKIEEFSSLSKKNHGTVLLLYFLFFMPIIPFGAICYYGSSTKIKYPRYLLTVATGVIPSIVVSNLMGGAAKAFFANSLPIWLLILIIVLLAALLFFIIYLFLNKFYFKENLGTPDSILNIAFFRFVDFIRRGKQKLRLDPLPEDLSTPYLLLSNHESFWDFYYLYCLTQAPRASYVVNRYYLTRPFARRHYKKAGFIPKKLFNPDPATSMGIIRMLKKGYPVILFPEGRLSTDGRTNQIREEGGALYRKLKVDLLLVKIEGAYFAKPKWRPSFFRSDISVRVVKHIKKEELANYTDEELNRLISSSLYSDASQYKERNYPQMNKAKGLSDILYRCADCGALYTTEGKGNSLFCTACGAEHTLDEHYRFIGTPTSIADYYRAIEALEKKDLDSLTLTAPVKTKVFAENGKTVRKEEGECRLTKDGFSYRSAKESFTIPIDRLPALPYSVGEEFEVYQKENLYYFYPIENRRQVVRWALLVDLLCDRRKEEN
ncbi:MAG: VTT domain-containing protein [Clostridia bacterium]|nr:VTT domain-containing protein [Clostridia bacterium]